MNMREYIRVNVNDACLWLWFVILYSMVSASKIYITHRSLFFVMNIFNTLSWCVMYIYAWYASILHIMMRSRRHIRWKLWHCSRRTGDVVHGQCRSQHGKRQQLYIVVEWIRYTAPTDSLTMRYSFSSYTNTQIIPKKYNIKTILTVTLYNTY